MTGAATAPRCQSESCPSESLSFASHCWLHLPDKDRYREDLQENHWELRGANLRGADLSRLVFDGASFAGANLEGADLSHANLDRSDLTGVALRKANLSGARLRGIRAWHADLAEANLSEADLSEADLLEAKLYRARFWRTELRRARSLAKSNFASRESGWTRHRLDERSAEMAVESYRILKQHLLSVGRYDDASWASYREKIQESRLLFKRRSPTFLPSALMNVLCGYGEIPYRVILASAAIILAYSCGYVSFQALGGAVGEATDFWEAFYFSIVAFATVGFGDIVAKPVAGLRLLTASEGFVGAFMIGLFVFTLGRRYTAR